jgi:Na+/H+-dicarboxylate symporter
VAAAGDARRLPLYVRILAGVAVGVLLALTLGPRVRVLGDLGMLVIQLLKALASPLIFFAVLDAFARTHIPGRQALRLVALSTLNAAVAIALGLGVAHAVNAGASLAPAIRAATSHETVAAQAHPSASLDPLANLAGHVPESVVAPFARNAVISVVLLAVLLGLALRGLLASTDDETRRAGERVAAAAHAGLALFARALHLVVELIPFAVLGVVAKVVSRTGVEVFRMLLPFVGTVLLGLSLQAVVWYGIMVATLGRRSPVAFFRGALDAAVTALSSGSSLATLPVTLRCLHDRLGVSPASARLAACVGTNLNHDGIILYEATAVIFVTQALGVHLSLGQQVAVALASVMAGVGIAGVPEAGLITLPLVLHAAGVPDAVSAAVVPLILPVDWILGRARACTNVLADMSVAVILHRHEDDAPRESDA